MFPLTDAYLQQMQREFPRLKLVHKNENRWSAVLNTTLGLLSLGRASGYSADFTTTLGTTIYLPSVWTTMSDAARYLTLRHEVVHLRQFQRYSFAGMAFFYLVPLFPIGLAAGRAWLEWQAYRETMVATAELFGVEVLDDPAFRQEICGQFCNAAYGWMWPFPRFWRDRYDAAARTIRRRVGFAQLRTLPRSGTVD